MTASSDRGPAFAPFSETEARGHHRHPAAVAMTVVVFIVGSLLAWRILVHPGVATLVSRGDSLAKASTATVASPEDAALGRRMATERCAGCHMDDARLVGPSWTAISRRYDAGSTQASRDLCLPRLVSAVGHPRPGWDGYQPGPQLELNLDERSALAAFIIEAGRGASASGGRS